MDAAGVLALSTALGCSGAAGMKLGGLGYGRVSRELARRSTADGAAPSLAVRAERVQRAVAVAADHVPRLRETLDRARRARHQRELRQTLPQALRLLCIAIDSGNSLPQALEYAARNSTGAIARELKRAVWDAKAGKSFEEAMEGLRKRTGGSEFACLAVAMEIQHRCGGTLSQILHSVSQMLQQSAELEEELVTKTTQAQLSARVVALMPIAVVALLSLVSPGYLGQFFDSLPGVALLIMAVVLEVAGVVLVKRSMAVDVGMRE